MDQIVAMVTHQVADQWNGLMTHLYLRHAVYICVEIVWVTGKEGTTVLWKGYIWYGFSTRGQ